MNTKILIPAALVAVALLVAFLILGFLDTGKPGPAASEGEEGGIVSESVEVEYADISGGITAAGADVAVQQAVLGAPDAASIAGGAAGAVDVAREQILETIHEASVTYDVEGLKVLGPLLGHADPEVRAATIEGIIQLGETAGAKTLREAARRAKDSREAGEMIRAAKFLELPEYQPGQRR
jgi:hypothetical protein